jgi:hypothetical protein
MRVIIGMLISSMDIIKGDRMNVKIEIIDAENLFGFHRGKTNHPGIDINSKGIKL